MSSPSSPLLVPLLLAHLGSAMEGGVPSSALESVLGELVARARAAWPGVELSPEAFVGYLGRRLPPGEAPERSLRAVHAEDLYLAAACVEGEAGARAALEAHYLPRMRAAARRVLQDADAAEVVQRVRTRLVWGEAGGAPGLAAYQGRGPLAAWLRAAVVRAALNTRRAGARQERAEQEAIASATLGPAADWVPPSERHAEDFRAALAEALEALPARERTLLRLHLVEGLSLERLGTVYRAHKSTVSRWLAQAREEVREGTRVRLAERLRLSPSEVHSLVRDEAEQWDQTLSGLLATRK